MVRGRSERKTRRNRILMVRKSKGINCLLFVAPGTTSLGRSSGRTARKTMRESTHRSRK